MRTFAVLFRCAIVYDRVQYRLNKCHYQRQILEKENLIVFVMLNPNRHRLLSIRNQRVPCRIQINCSLIEFNDNPLNLIETSTYKSETYYSHVNGYLSIFIKIYLKAITCAKDMALSSGSMWKILNDKKKLTQELRRLWILIQNDADDKKKWICFVVGFWIAWLQIELKKSTQKWAKSFKQSFLI